MRSGSCLASTGRGVRAACRRGIAASEEASSSDRLQQEASALSRAPPPPVPGRLALEPKAASAYGSRLRFGRTSGACSSRGHGGEGASGKKLEPTLVNKDPHKEDVLMRNRKTSPEPGGTKRAAAPTKGVLATRSKLQNPLLLPQKVSFFPESSRITTP